MKILNIVLTVVLFLSQLYAQPFGMQNQQRKRLEEFKKIKLIETLELSEQEAAKFFPAYSDHQNKVQKLQRERDRLLDELERISKNEEKFKNEKFEEIVQKLNEIEQELIRNRIEFHNQLRNILPAFKVARYFVLERNFMRELNKLLMMRRNKGIQ